MKRFADKSHQHVLNLPVLIDAFPRAQFIHVVRDGRGVVASMLRHPGVMPWFSDKHIGESSEWPQPWYGIRDHAHYLEWREWSDTRKCALRWRSWVEAGLRDGGGLPGDQWLTVNYEDVVLYPRRTAQHIFDFVGLPMVEETIDGIKSASVDRWKKDLSADQLAEIEAVAGDLQQQLGYT